MLHRLSCHLDELHPAEAPDPERGDDSEVRQLHVLDHGTMLGMFQSTPHNILPHLELLALLRLELPRALPLLLPGGRVAVLLGAQLLYVPHQLEK